MKILKKVRGLSVFYKRVLVFGALFLLAIPFLVFIIHNFSFRMAELAENNLLEKLNFNQSEQAFVTSSFNGMFADLDLLQELLASSTNATDTDLWLENDEAYYIYENEASSSPEEMMNY